MGDLTFSTLLGIKEDIISRDVFFRGFQAKQGFKPRSLRVVGLAGPLCTISVDLGATTVFEAQKMIAKSAGIPTQEQQLISHNRGLSRHEILGKALGESDEVTLLRRDSKSLAVESAKITGALALERARRMAMQRGSNIQNAA